MVTPSHRLQSLLLGVLILWNSATLGEGLVMYKAFPGKASTQFASRPALPSVVDSAPSQAASASESFNACGDGSPANCALAGVKELKAGNRDEGLRLLRDACALNDILGCTKYGLEEAELGNWKNAEQPLARACKMGAEVSCDLIRTYQKKAHNYARDVGDVGAKVTRQIAQDKDPRSGVYEDERYCTQISSAECLKLAVEEDRKGNTIKSMSLLSEACEKGEGMACARYGVVESHKMGGNKVLGKKALKRACTLGVSDTCEMSAD